MRGGKREREKERRRGGEKKEGKGGRRRRPAPQARDVCGRRPLPLGVGWTGACAALSRCERGHHFIPAAAQCHVSRCRCHSGRARGSLPHPTTT